MATVNALFRSLIIGAEIFMRGSLHRFVDCSRNDELCGATARNCGKGCIGSHVPSALTYWFERWTHKEFLYCSTTEAERKHVFAAFPDIPGMAALFRQIIPR